MKRHGSQSRGTGKPGNDGPPHLPSAQALRSLVFHPLALRRSATSVPRRDLLQADIGDPSRTTPSQNERDGKREVLSSKPLRHTTFTTLHGTMSDINWTDTILPVEEPHRDIARPDGRSPAAPADVRRRGHVLSIGSRMHDTARVSRRWFDTKACVAVVAIDRRIVEADIFVPITIGARQVPPAKRIEPGSLEDLHRHGWPFPVGVWFSSWIVRGTPLLERELRQA